MSFSSSSLVVFRVFSGVSEGVTVRLDSLSSCGRAIFVGLEGRFMR